MSRLPFARHITEREFIVLMALLMSIVAISIDATLPALGMITRDLGVTNPNHSQYIIGFIFIGMSLGEIVCGPLSDAWGRKKILYIGIVLFLLGSIICYLSHSLPMMLVGRIIQGLGVAGPYVSAVSVVRDKFSGREMARIMSLVMMIFIMVPAIAPSLGQAVMLFLDWRAIFLMYVLYGIITGSWIHIRLEETLPPQERIPFCWNNILHGFKEIIGNRITMGYTLCMGFCFGGFMGYLSSSQQIFQVHFNTGKLFTLYFGGLALAFGASSLLNSHLVGRYGMRLISKTALVMGLIVSLVFLILNLTMAVPLWMFVIYAGIMFMGIGLLAGNLNALAMEPMGHIAGIAAALTGAVSGLTSMTLGSITGQFYNDTLIPMTLGFIASGILSLCAMAYAEHKPKTL